MRPENLVNTISQQELIRGEIPERDVTHHLIYDYLFSFYH